MEQKDVIVFFDRRASTWDANMVRNEAVISEILDNAGVRPGADVLDVACGTGVLFPDYLKRNVHSVTAIDLSPAMARIAHSKFPDTQIHVICGDVETTQFQQFFDCIVVYNAFPHFPEPERLICILSGLLNPGGMLTVAHGMSRSALNRHHSGHARKVSIGLLHENELSDIFARYLTVTTKISDSRMYQVAGIRTPKPSPQSLSHTEHLHGG